jgi:hypothetical protein
MATEKAAKEKFKKGHRRAHSMPLAVHKLERGITDDQLDDDDEAPKVTVNYNVRYQHEEAPGPSSRRNPVRFDVDEIEIIEDEDDFSVSVFALILNVFYFIQYSHFIVGFNG